MGTFRDRDDRKIRVRDGMEMVRNTNALEKVGDRY